MKKAPKGLPLFGFFLLAAEHPFAGLFATHPGKHQVLPDNVTGRGERHHRACVQSRNPDDKRRVLLPHALRPLDRAALAFAEPPEPEEQNAQHQRHPRHHRELAAVPQVHESHLADIETRLRNDDEHRERPDEHRVLLEFRGAVGKLRVERAEPERKRERYADDGLDGIENLHRDFGEARIGASKVPENDWDGKACEQVSAQEYLEGERRRTTEHLGHRGGGIRRRAQRDDGTAQQHLAREPEQFHDTPQGGNQHKACDKRAGLDLERVAVSLRRNLRDKRQEHHRADKEGHHRRKHVRLREQYPENNRQRHQYGPQILHSVPKCRKI